MEIPMFTKTKMALAVALVLGAASAVQASDTRNDTGGYRVGPLGQTFQGANPAYHRSARGAGAYAFVPRHRPEGRFDRNWFGFQDCPGPDRRC